MINFRLLASLGVSWPDDGGEEEECEGEESDPDGAQV